MSLRHHYVNRAECAKKTSKQCFFIIVFNRAPCELCHSVHGTNEFLKMQHSEVVCVDREALSVLFSANVLVHPVWPCGCCDKQSGRCVLVDSKPATVSGAAVTSRAMLFCDNGYCRKQTRTDGYIMFSHSHLWRTVLGAQSDSARDTSVFSEAHATKWADDSNEIWQCEKINTRHEEQIWTLILMGIN